MYSRFLTLNLLLLTSTVFCVTDIKPVLPADSQPNTPAARPFNHFDVLAGFRRGIDVITPTSVRHDLGILKDKAQNIYYKTSQTIKDTYTEREKHFATIKNNPAHTAGVALGFGTGAACWYAVVKGALALTRKIIRK